jgi:hypothetical protein
MSFQKADTAYTPEKNKTGKGIIGEEALRLPFVMFGDRVCARSLTALSRRRRIRQKVDYHLHYQTDNIISTTRPQKSTLKLTRVWR